MSRWRHGIAGLLWVAGAVLLFGLFAGGEPGQPWSPAERLVLEPEALQSPTSRLEAEDGGVRIHGTGPGAVGLVVHGGDGFDASRYRYFRLDIDDSGAEQRLLLFLRSDGQQASVLMPGIGHGGIVLDLASAAAWKGTIDAVGVLLLPTDYLAGAEAPERTPLLRGAVLESASWQGAIAALRDRWFGYRPWNGRSNNTGGFEHGPDAGPSLSAFIAAVVGWGILMAWLGGAVPLRRRAVQAVAAGCALLAAVQVGQLFLRSTVAVAAASQVTADSEWPLAAAPSLAHDALELQRFFGNAPPSRLLVWSSDRFLGEYPAWLLRRYNVASIAPWHTLGDTAKLAAENTFVVVSGEKGWRFDEARGELVLGEQRLWAQPVWRGAALRGFRVREGGRQ